MEPTIEQAQNTTATNRMFIASLEWVSSFWAISTLVLTGLAALSGALAWYFSDKLADAKGDELERFKDASKVAISEANATAELAKKDAAEARLALAKFKAPRIDGFDEAKRDRISEKLKPFAGKQFDVGIVAGDAECEMLLPVLESVMKKAGFIQIDWVNTSTVTVIYTRVGQPVVGCITAKNVIVEIDLDKDSELGRAAKSISEALIAEGIPAEGNANTVSRNSNTRAIHLLIGQKME